MLEELVAQICRRPMICGIYRRHTVLVGDVALIANLSMGSVVAVDLADGGGKINVREHMAEAWLELLEQNDFEQISKSRGNL